MCTLITSSLSQHLVMWPLQLLSAVVRHFTQDMAPVTMGAKARTPAEAWGSTSGEVLALCLQLSS